VSGTAERLKAYYELRATEGPASDPEATLRFDKALAAAGLRPGERVLDVGAKRGGLALRARETGLDIDYVGLDVSEENVRAAALLQLDVRQADVTKPLPIGAAEFDCVFCLEILEHLTSAVAMLEEMRRVIRESGRAVISVPSPYSWVEVYRELFGRPETEGHLNAFTTPVMRNVLALAGFRLERRLGTSLRIPKTLRLIPTNSILARSRIYVARPAEQVTFAGRPLSTGTATRAD
jgi:2-polyprenyl-3-methyl-5-hydroxy-6-metoxy-1,4-benzoquinol methylase